MSRTVIIPSHNSAKDWIYAETGGLDTPGSGNNFAVAAHFLCDLNGLAYVSYCGLAGNINYESGWNPWRFEDDDIGDYEQGVGLVQWTPGTKMTEWCATAFGSEDAWRNGYNQLARIIYEKNNSLQWIPTERFPFSWDRFWNPYNYTPQQLFPQDYKLVQDLEDVAYLMGLAWCYNYERPQIVNQPARGDSAVYWFTHGGNFGYNPHKFKIILPKRKKQYRKQIIRR